MRNKCLVCGSELGEKPIYICKNMPPTSQNLPSLEQLKDDKLQDFNLYQCTGCGLVQFDCDPVFYYKDSTRAGERCDALIKLRQEQYTHLIEAYQLKGKKIIEFGCGKGGFLRTLKEMTQYQIQEYGVEFNAEYVRIAREKEGVNVVQGDVENANLCIKDGPFDAFTSFAYPARLIHPNEFMHCIYHNTTNDAVGLIMVPSMEHLIKPGGFYDITPDHIAYYDKSTLHFLLQKNGFEVLECGEVSQIYIYAIVKKRKNYSLYDVWSDVEPLACKVREYVTEKTKDGKKLAIWCAGHFTFTVIPTAKIEDKVSYIIDNATFKQGKFSPGSHVPIYGVEHFHKEPVDTILILGPIYVDELVDEIKRRCSENVSIATMDRNGIKIIKE